MQHLTPVPRGGSLPAMSASILAQLDADFARRRDAEGRWATERFAEEAARLRPLPVVPFDPRKVVMVQVSRCSLVRVEAATYSVPSSWAGLAATAYVGIDDVRIVCRGQQHSVARKRRGQQEIRYRHYLKELARKPQAVRQVAPELFAELGPPYERLWSMLEGRYGGLEAASSHACSERSSIMARPRWATRSRPLWATAAWTCCTWRRGRSSHRRPSPSPSRWRPTRSKRPARPTSTCSSPAVGDERRGS